MTRFLMLLAAAAVAGVMYVAAAPGGATRSGPTAAQFKALSKKVTTLQKQVANLKKEADASLGILGVCVMHQPVGVDQVGTSSSGYLFGPPQTAPNAVTAAATSALNLAPSTEASPQHRVFELNTSESACVKIAGSVSTPAAARSVAAFAGRR
jgi:outer membrane murein-binding lipoprotein Lpp